MADVTADRNAILPAPKIETVQDFKPCPFCGSTRIGRRGSTVFYILCLDCEASTGCYTEKAEAWKAWNGRANNG